MAYPPEFLKLVDQFIDLANKLAEEKSPGEVSAAILFAAGRYNAFNILSQRQGQGGAEQNQTTSTEYYVSEYRKAITSNLKGAVGSVVGPKQ